MITHTWTITINDNLEDEERDIWDGIVYGFRIDFGDGYSESYSLEDPDSIFEGLPEDITAFFQRHYLRH